MALVTWGPSLEVGIQLIDSQHKRLVDLINQLDDAQKQGRGNEVIGETLEDAGVE
jgi:hemerythrin